MLVAALIVGRAAAAPGSVQAGPGPWLNVGYWDEVQNCITGLYGSGTADDLNRRTLPGEWYPFWDADALQAGATIIRSDQLYYYFTPERNYLCNRSGYAINYRDTTFQGFPHAYDPATDAAVIGTSPQGITQGPNYQVVFLDFYACTQNNTQYRASQGADWYNITTSNLFGVYVPPLSTGCNSTRYNLYPTWWNGY